ncbi:MAG: glycosyltransferase [Desulfobacterales bacterium]
MKKILMLSYYFPPITDVGGLRALGFAENLPAHGWEPHVLSVRNPDRSVCGVGDGGPPAGIDTRYCRSLFHLNRASWKANGVLRLLLRAVGIRLRGNIVHELFCLPDVFAGWIVPAYAAGLRIMKQEGIDLIYVSSKPFSSTLAGVLLKKATGKPLVLDFRDPASFPDSLFMDNRAGRTRKRIIGRIERYVLENADALLTTTRATEEAYLERYPFLAGRTRTIYNGFYLPGIPMQAVEPFDVFTIVYMGNFYHDLVPSDTFFEALRAVVDQGRIPADRIRFLYVGGLRGKDNWLMEAGRRHQVSHLIRTAGQVSREEAQSILARSALMLLRIVPPMISTKLFEGLRDGVPMLAIIEEGEVAELIRVYSPRSYVVTSHRAGDAADAICEAYRRWEKGELTPQIHTEYRNRFNKKSLTAAFREVLEAVIDNPRDERLLPLGSHKPGFEPRSVERHANH